MRFSSLNFPGMRFSRLLLFAGGLVVLNVHAGIFDDDEARKAILDLRQQVEQVRGDVGTTRRRMVPPEKKRSESPTATPAVAEGCKAAASIDRSQAAWLVDRAGDRTRQPS